MASTGPRYIGTIDVPAYPDGDGGYLAGAVRTVGYLAADGTIVGEDHRLDVPRYLTGDAARAAVAAAHPGVIPGASRLRGREVRA